MSRPKVICSVVVSPNGFIADLDGSEDWITQINWEEFTERASAVDNFVVGRETYDVVTKLYEHDNFDSMRVTNKIIVSANPSLRLPAGYVLVDSPAAAVDYLNHQDCKTVLLAGGGKLNAAFAAAGLIDELELIIEPHLLGEGRPVFSGLSFENDLELKEHELLSGGRFRLLYDVKRGISHG